MAGGNYWALEWDNPGVFSDRFVSSEVASETGRILQMWWSLECMYAKYSKEDQERVLKETGVAEVRFKGFYLNEEGEHADAAEIIIDDLDRFPSCKGRNLNSAPPHSLDVSRRMLVAFDKIIKEESADLTP